MSDNLNSAFDPKKMALSSKSEELFVKRSWTNKKKTCWKCQKEKQILGGHLKVAPNFFKFICKECCDLKKQQQEAKT
jgi:hypothetical protein